MFCFSKTCRICKRSSNSFTLTCNSQKGVSNLFFSMFPELMNSQLNQLLQNLCVACVEQLLSFENFKNHCLESDLCYMRYLNQLEGHDCRHAELVCKLGLKQEECQNQPTFDNYDIQEASSYYCSTALSNCTTEDIQIDIVKQEISMSDIAEESGSEEFIKHCIENDHCYTRYVQQLEGDDDTNVELVCKLGIKQEDCQNDDNQIQSSIDINGTQEASSYYGSAELCSNIAEDIQIDIVKQEICMLDIKEENGDAMVEEEISILHYEEYSSKEIQDPLALTNQDLFTSNYHRCIDDQNPDFTVHKNTHTGEKPYECDICKKSFPQKSNLAIHKRTHTGEKPYQCDLCKKSFPYKHTFISHKRTHTGEKPYECDKCNKSFSQKSAMMTHKRTHTGEKPYQCDICKKSFTQKANLAFHKKTHTGEKPYECDICKKSFSDKSYVIAHKRTHTGEKPYQCEICKKSFSQQSHMIIHKRTHTGEKPYECDICKKSFSYKSYVIAHRRTHTGEKPYQCDICKKSFSQQSYMIIHKRTHSGEKPYQ